MFLKEITLSDFKCHENLCLNFQKTEQGNDSHKTIRKTTFLLGENGTGKSAFLKAIAIITGGSNALGDLLGNPNDWIKNGARSCEIKACITTAEGDERQISFRLERDASLNEVISQNIRTLDLIDSAIKKAERNYFVLAYGASRRLNRSGETFYGKSSRRSNNSRSGNVQSLFNPDAPLISLTNWAMELDYEKGKEGLTVIRNALNNFLLKDVVFNRIDKRAGKLIFDTADGEIALENLSDGYQNVAAWVGDLMYNVTRAFGDYKNPLNARGLLLIDEIDLHLHPKWQRNLHQFLKQMLPNFQIVATTHSPLTAQQAELGELYALRRDAGSIELIPFVGDPSKLLLHQLLTSPVFGLQTDESVQIENAKEEIRKVRLKDNPTQQELESIKPYQKLVEETPISIRKNSLLSEKDIERLKSINARLGKKVLVSEIKNIVSSTKGTIRKLPALSANQINQSPIGIKSARKVVAVAKKALPKKTASIKKSTPTKAAAKKAVTKKSSTSKVAKPKTVTSKKATRSPKK